MLNPDARSLYTGAVTPPPGYIFDQAIATTYSLDPATLLSLPTHIALAERPSATPVDPIRLLESLRRLSDRFTVYIDHTGIKLPSGSNILFGLLEQMVIPVKAPRGGVFHPKIWVLRFIQPDLDKPALIRLLILSRNITYDRSWDISLQLEGQPGGRYIAANRPLGELLQSLPSFSMQRVSKTRRLQAEQLAEEVRKTEWELPEGFEEVSFHVLGMDNWSWSPSSDRMAVISPFVTDEALSWLSDQTEELTAFISRPDELNKLSNESLKLTKKWLTLDEAAETEDGEEPDQRDTVGLHAKVYVVEKGWWTSIFLGSANATGAALLHRSNIEILAELKGKKSKVGNIEKLLGEDGLGQVLTEYIRSKDIQQPDEEKVRAQKVLEAARSLLADAELKLDCKKDNGAWLLTLISPRRIKLPGISQLYAWPITVKEERAVDILDLCKSKIAELGRYATESVTGLIAFEIVTTIKNMSLLVVLNLPVIGLPEDRDDAIFKLVLNNKEGFLRYILLLLSEYSGGFISDGFQFGRGKGPMSWADNFSGETPILEELARAFSRSPDKLADVRAVMNRLKRDQTTTSVVPPEFLQLWAVFETALSEVGK